MKSKKKPKAKSSAKLVPVRPPTTAVMRAVDQHYILRLNGEPDGSFGPATQTNVKSFQTALGTTATGVVDATTWRYLVG